MQPSDPKPVNYFSRGRFLDLLAASPLVVWYLLGIGNLVFQIAAGVKQWPADVSQWPAAALNILVSLAIITSLSLFVAIFFARRLPIARAEGALPQIVAILATNLELTIALLPKQPLSPSWNAVASIVLLAGTGGMIYVLRHLGRNFSILPQARGLVTRGPYSRIRHPLYLAETIATLGVTFSYRQPWAALIVVATFPLQLVRMGYEEDVLTRAFPEYAGYMKRTWRLVPGVY